jgi:sugar phosphate isomerase/epimerase
MNLNRREFIKGISATTAVVAGSGAMAFAIPQNQNSKVQIAFFTKLLDKYENEFLAETLAMAGVDGFDVTVRPKGKIEPEKVKDDFPRFVETGKKYGLKTEMMVTGISTVNEPYTREVLETAAKLGVKHYRTQWLDIDFKKGVDQSLAEIKSKFEELTALNKSLGIQAGYQNHSGVRFGAAIWDLYGVIKDLPVQYFGSQYDIRHAMCEGSASWIIGLHRIKNNISSLAMKDFTWKVTGKKFEIVSVPMGEGLIDFDKYFKTLKELGIKAPVTLHVEYPLLTADEEKLPLLEQQKLLVPKIKHDVDFVRSNFQKYQLG